MNDRIRVLAIAPYEGMKQLMTAMANDYPQSRVSRSQRTTSTAIMTQ